MHVRRLNLTTLEERRKQGDLTEMYKLLTQKENVDYKQFFQKKDKHPGYGAIVPRCSFLASEQISGNRFSATGSWTAAGTGYLRWLLMQTLCRHSNQDTTDSSKI